MGTTASGGVDRTVLRLNYEGHQPDTEAMGHLYDNPETIIFREITQENGGGTQERKGELTLPEVAQILNLSLGGIEKIVRQLKQAGALIREGSTKAGRRIVKD